MRLEIILKLLFGIILGLILAGALFALIRWQMGRVAPPMPLGLQNGQLAPCPPNSINCVRSQADSTWHYSTDAASAQAALLALLQAQPRVNIVVQQPGYIHAEFHSLVWNFIDDVEFAFDPTQPDIHYRSASRAGKGDLGANAARMKLLLAAWQAQPR
jgi:uncharacterized protein (DUF1499 family)